MQTSNISMTGGDTEVLQVDFTDETGTLVNDAGAVYTLTAKVARADAAAVFTVTAHQTTAGVAFLTIAPANTSGLTDLSVLVYDVEVVETGGRTTTVVGGTLTVNPPVHAE